MDSMTKQRREGEANRPTRAKTGQRKLIKPSWTEFVRLADQAVVAFAGADMINRAEPRACGCSRRSRRLDTKWPETDERQLLRQTKPRRVSEGRRRTRLASSRTGERRHVCCGIRDIGRSSWWWQGPVMIYGFWKRQPRSYRT